ncbi:MAG: hypothetical protein L6Q98_18310 [Anaerolineae bacterium]|nr:hypothetical protein [Anaerolineae bacterium]
MQLLQLLRRWLPQRKLAVVGDSEFAALDFLAHTQRLKLTFVTRLRIKYAPIALLSTDRQADPALIVTWFVQRWQLAVTFEATRRHLGLETQRQWSDKAIARTTPLLLGLFSWVTLLADALQTRHPASAPRQAAWYAKPLPTFSDALALVRQFLWTVYPTFRTSREEPDMLKIPKPLFDTLVSTLSYAA